MDFLLKLFPQKLSRSNYFIPLDKLKTEEKHKFWKCESEFENKLNSFRSIEMRTNNGPSAECT